MMNNIIQTVWITSADTDFEHRVPADVNKKNRHSLRAWPDRPLAHLSDLIGALEIRILGFLNARLLPAG